MHWNAEWRARLAGVAIVTDNAMYRMVIGAMSLASSQQMRAFANSDEAAAWLRTLPASHVDAA